MRLPWISLVVLLWGGVALAQATEVVVEGLGANRRVAIDDALRRGVEQVLGTYVRSEQFLQVVSRTTQVTDQASRQRIVNDVVEVFRDRVRGQASGFARLIEVQREESRAGQVRVVALVAVSEPGLLQEFRSHLLRRGDPRVTVLIPEFVLPVRVPDPAVETEINRSLASSGFRVVASRISSQTASLAQIGSLVGTRGAQDLLGDILVTGEAFAERISPQPPELRAAGYLGYSARIEVRIVDVASGQVVFSAAYTGGGVGLGENVAAKTALQNTAQRALDGISLELMRWMVGGSQAVARVFPLELRGLPNFRVASEAAERIRDLSDVESVTARSFSASVALLEVAFVGRPDELALELESLGWRVLELDGSRLVVQWEAP